MATRIRLAARSAMALEVSEGQRIRVEDIEGGQVADLTACAVSDPREWLANGQTFDYNASLRMTTGRILYSNRSRENLLAAFAERGIEPTFLPTPCNAFMGVELDANGGLKVLPARSRRGEAIVFAARADLVIGVAACSAPACNGGTFGPIGVEVS